ncbi:hypothetical protein AMS68_001065 [Peltaster fructicola]|uniref:SET domain-containing protein n=1 Tax=Peltaster fructicola TaxID=286661 RepID=A0A6H0XLQ0_9PEZI|nr:hypothetical protein AMS68_001065 [Peltaster fructicola]
MFRRGKTEGWLTVPRESFRAWSELNDVVLHDLEVTSISGKGSALAAAKDIANTENGAECLLTVPRGLILSLESVRGHALVDQDFREVLESVEDFGRSARGAILVFLLLQVSTACELETGTFGVHSPFTYYVNSLPAEALPTSWTQDELSLLVGTTLAPATAFKLRSLRKEYDNLCTAAAATRWWKQYGHIVDFEDWIGVDAMYRSRALDYPNVGHCMVPCLDIANHESGDATIAVYDLDSNGNAILLLRDGKALARGTEVTISYGDEKGACEMIFSYGFLESDRESAEALFLDLSPSADDQFGAEKRRYADCAPGFKLIDVGEGQVDWSGDFVWLLCLYPEDGLHFDLANLVDGTQEIQAFFGEHELKDGAAGLRRTLAQSELWDVWRLRALSILQTRVAEQLQVLLQTQDHVEDAAHSSDISIDKTRCDMAMRLRMLEFQLLNQAYEDFAEQMQGLAQSTVVVQYLQAQQAQNLNSSEDFS